MQELYKTVICAQLLSCGLASADTSFEDLGTSFFLLGPN